MIDSPKAAAEFVGPLTEWQQENFRWYGYTHCPHCGIDLDNGITTDECQRDQRLPRNEEFELCCLGCGGEFGEPIRKAKKGPKRGNYDMSLREKCFELYFVNERVKDVAARLGITYANAHYYKRAFIKANKEA